MFHVGHSLPCLSFKVLLKKKKKIFHFSNTASLSVSYLLKGKSILLGEIFLLSAQEEKVEHMSERSLPPLLTSATPSSPTQPGLSGNLCLAESCRLLFPPLPSLLPHWLVPAQELRDPQVLTRTPTSEIKLGTQVFWSLTLRLSPHPHCCYSTGLLILPGAIPDVSAMSKAHVSTPVSHLNLAPDPFSTDTT